MTKTTKKHVTFRIPQDLDDLLKQKASTTRKTVTQVINEALQESFKKPDFRESPSGEKTPQSPQRGKTMTLGEWLKKHRNNKQTEKEDSTEEESPEEDSSESPEGEKPLPKCCFTCQ